MSEEKRKYNCLIRLGENSQLKTDLNKGIASLQTAEESKFQPHLCLNGKEGLEVIRRIASDSGRANTEIWLREQIICDGVDGIWLNVNFSVFIDKICWPTDNVKLSPRQTAYIILNLPSGSQEIVLRKIKEWYFKKLLPELGNGLAAITEQFKNGDPLIKSDDKNRILDIHGGRHMDVEYTEERIIGERLFYIIFLGHTLFHAGQDGYRAADQFLSGINKERKLTADRTIGLLREIKGL